MKLWFTTFILQFLLKDSVRKIWCKRGYCTLWSVWIFLLHSLPSIGTWEQTLPSIIQGNWKGGEDIQKRKWFLFFCFCKHIRFDQLWIFTSSKWSIFLNHEKSKSGRWSSWTGKVEASFWIKNRRILISSSYNGFNKWYFAALSKVQNCYWKIRWMQQNDLF